MVHEVLTGDSAVVLRDFPDNHFDCIVTDPPHGLFFMGAEWDAELPAQAIWDECFRVVKPGGHAWVMSSERWGCAVGLYRALSEAGFAIDEHQCIFWLTLTGMPKSTDVSKGADKEAFRAWLAHVGADLTPAERRKAESAAVNGEGAPDFRNGPDTNPATRGDGTMGEGLGGYKDRTEDLSLLSSLLAEHWPSSPADRRAQWEAVVAELPEEWDCSRPPGVRVKTGDYVMPPDSDGGLAGKTMTGDYSAGRASANVFGGDRDTGGGVRGITAPSTPDACALDGWRGSVATFKPLAYPVLHAVKPWRGSYLAGARDNGGAVLNMQAGAIPFEHETSPAQNRWGGAVEEASVDQDRTGNPFQQGMGPGVIAEGDGGRVPGNLLSHADLLRDLQRYADLDAWTKRLGLPDAAADLLEAGAIYAPKSSRAEKSAGLPEGYDAERNPCSKPLALCAYFTAISTRPGETVLDPFCGEGPVGVACKRLGRQFVGVELEEDYAETARLRIAAAEEVAAPEQKPEQFRMNV